jgi:hypothetical protein
LVGYFRPRPNKPDTFVPASYEAHRDVSCADESGDLFSGIEVVSRRTSRCIAA